MQVTPGANIGGMLGPNGEPLTDGSMGKSPKNRTGGGKRRRNGRWAEHETNTLIELVRQWGKGKWKKILEEGAAAFNNRSQVPTLCRLPLIKGRETLPFGPFLHRVNFEGSTSAAYFCAVISNGRRVTSGHVHAVCVEGWGLTHAGWYAQVDLKDKWRNLERQGVVQASDGVLPGSAGVLSPEQQQAQQQQQQQQPMVDAAALMAPDGGAMMQVQDPAAAAAAAAAAHAQAVGQQEQMMHHVEGGMPAQM